MPISSRRREALLEHVHDLRARLESASVPRLHRAAGGAGDERGVPGSVAGHAAAFLARSRDLERFRRYLELSDDIDRTSAQNPDNPAAQHAVFRREIERFLAEGEVRTAEELLYVLGWLRRTLPKKPERSRAEGRRSDTGTRGDRSRGPGGRPAPQPAPTRRERPDLPKPNTTVQAVLLAERTKKGGWRARHLSTGIEGHVNNSHEMPADLEAGTELDLVVASATETVIAFRYAAKKKD